jgi:hypothetical protein
MLEDVREKARQSAQRSDAGDSAGRDVLDPSEQVVRRLCTRVEMEHERSVGTELERRAIRQTIRERSVAIALSCHWADDTARCRPTR